ncbi:MAG: hypothetical protein KA791_07770 [Flavobacteriales bacterium]|nr:hypothetical protein [Flavobacteriales bacterium]
MKYVIAFLLLVAIGLLVRLTYLVDVDPEEYHAIPVAVHLDDDLYGDPKALEDIPPLKPYIYLQKARRGEVQGYLLNVMLPLPDTTYVPEATFDMSDPRKLVVRYRVQCNDPGGIVKGLYHQTLIPVSQGVDSVIVECAMDGGGTERTRIHTDHSDSEDPITGGPPTPYMSGTATYGMLAFSGGEMGEATVAVPGATLSGAEGRRILPVPATPEFQLVGPMMAGQESLRVGERVITGVR